MRMSNLGIQVWSLAETVGAKSWRRDAHKFVANLSSTKQCWPMAFCLLFPKQLQLMGFSMNSLTEKEFVPSSFGGLSPFVSLSLLLDPVPSWFWGDLLLPPFVFLLLDAGPQWFQGLSPFVPQTAAADGFLIHSRKRTWFHHDFEACVPLSPFYWMQFRHDSRFVSFCLPFAGSSSVMISRSVSLCLPSCCYKMQFRHDFQMGNRLAWRAAMRSLSAPWGDRETRRERREHRRESAETRWDDNKL